MHDFRSDTVTRPTPRMMEAIASAVVGDDVYGEDPTVRELEHEVARMFGQEAGLYCVSGTMSNQLAILAQTRPGDEIICSDLCHLYHYEAGGLAANAGVQVRLLSHVVRPGQFEHGQVEEVIRHAEDVHYARSAVLAVEDTSNRGGGSIWPMEELEALHEVARARGLKFHLDGARVWNRLVATGVRSQTYGALYDSISVCLSKGLGAPMGSVLLGSTGLIERARWYRKRLGGGVRQAGFMAAAGLHAVRHHIEGLREDHDMARALASILSQSEDFIEVCEPQTNIVLARQHHESRWLEERASACGVRYSRIDAQWVRFVTHQDVRGGEALEQVRAMVRG